MRSDNTNALISGILQTIRRRTGDKEDYAFSESQVIELLRYEKDLEVHYMQGDGMWIVRLKPCDKNCMDNNAMLQFICGNNDNSDNVCSVGGSI